MENQDLHLEYDGVLKEKFKNYRLCVSAGLWERITNELDIVQEKGKNSNELFE